MIFSLQDKKHMEEVFSLAKMGKNLRNDPLVGAVVVKNNRVMARGYHKTHGADHAEVDAFVKVKDKKDLIGATLYTNLEPCSIYKRTPSCADQILKYRLKKVIISNQDPFPSVNGFGIKQLRKRGVKVLVGLLEQKGKKINQAFFEFAGKQKLQKPKLKISAAVSVDGKIVDVTLRESKISSSMDFNYKDKERSKHDAIMIGGNTFLRDDPSLLISDKNLRIKSYQKKGYPYPIKIAVMERIPPSVNLNGDFFRGREIKKIILTTGKTKRGIIDTIEKKSYLYEVFILGKKRVDLRKALELLAHFGIKKILVEGGGDLNFELINAKLIDELEIRINPVVLGGKNNPSVVFGKGFEMKNAPRPILEEIKKIGKETVLLRWRFR